MLTTGIGMKPNVFALVDLLRTATDLCCHKFGQQLHSYAIRSSYHYSNIYVSTSLIKFYVKMYSFTHAHNLFVEIPQPNVVSWNTLISGYVQAAMYPKALSLFIKLERSQICADAFSFMSAMTACAQLNLLKLGSSIHSQTVKLGLVNDTVVANCLIDMYGKCGSVERAVCVFSDITDKDVISWNSVIAACATNGKVGLGFKFLKLMPNPDAISYNGLINGIAQAGKIEDAVWILSTMPCPNSSSWNSVISGFVNRNRVHEALDIFRKMQLRNLQMDEFTFFSNFKWNFWFVSVNMGNVDSLLYNKVWFRFICSCRDCPQISACSHTQIPFEAAIRYFDAMINEYGIAPSIEHCCSVIRLMGQKGELQRAQQMIQELGFESRGVVWRSLLGACGTQEDLQVAEIAASKVIELERDEDYVYVMLSNMYASFGRWEDANIIRSLMSKKRVRKEAGSSWIEVNI
ncbi:hypothetical protein TSUD_397870 [Trifolium subterraneum]|uniref:Pentacotripeptide-repeat region of PRORP domain-containing protein n=1 Tax=Trifolium subterraneum TaxID=3900 RepID=A0A2Z6NF70_TRISU|nr:hypothetical protein TSUD_397870 [Trifolium subterraneum]